MHPVQAIAEALELLPTYSNYDMQMSMGMDGLCWILPIVTADGIERRQVLVRDVIARLDLCLAALGEDAATVCPQLTGFTESLRKCVERGGPLQPIRG